MKIHTAITLAASIGFAGAAHAAPSGGPDMKFIKEAAGIVWSTAAPEVSDMIKDYNSPYAEAPAEYISIQEIYDARRENSNAYAAFRNVNTDNLGETTVDSYARAIVRLNDAAGVESFSEKVFDAGISEKTGNGTVYFSEKNAFGARIHKPDGRIIDVDVSKALPVKEGKNDEVSSYKLAIPGLEPGDVLDYFIFCRNFFLGEQNVSADIEFFKDFPVASYSLRAVFDKTLTTQVNTFGGLEAENLHVGKGLRRDTVSLGLTGLKNYSTEFTNKARQLPHMRIRFADALSDLFGLSNSEPRPGLYFNLSPLVVMSGIARRFAAAGIPAADTGKAAGIVRDYRKRHPEADSGEIADAAWLASQYAANSSDYKYGAWDFAALFKDVADKVKPGVPVRMGIVCRKSEVPVSDIAGYDQATPVVFVGDRPYISDFLTSGSPGEPRACYRGETAFRLDGTRDRICTIFDETHKIGTDTIRESRPTDNASTLKIRAALDPSDPGKTNFSYTATRKGAAKEAMAFFISAADASALCEEYLGISGKKRSKRVYDLKNIDETRRMRLEKMPEIDFSLKNAAIDSAAIVNTGYLPDNPVFEYRVAGSADGLVTKAGRDLLVNIGKFMGADGFEKIRRDRPRELDIHTETPFNLKHILEFRIPDGYTADPAAISGIEANMVNICGSYVVKASYDEASRTVTVVTNFRNNRRAYPAKYWNDFLDLRDDRLRFAETVIVLTPE